MNFGYDVANEMWNTYRNLLQLNGRKNQTRKILNLLQSYLTQAHLNSMDTFVQWRIGNSSVLVE